MEEFDAWGKIIRSLQRTYYGKPADVKSMSWGGSWCRHYPAWLESERKKGRRFQVVRAIFQQTLHCSLDGAPIEFRADNRYWIPIEIAKYLIPQEIAVIEDPGAGPRFLEPMDETVKIKMLSDQTSAFPDGVDVKEYKAGETYDLPKPLAEGFIASGRAERAKEKDHDKRTKDT